MKRIFHIIYLRGKRFVLWISDIGITVLLTFAPFIIVASLPYWLEESSVDFSYWSLFHDYWDNGQIVLPILSLCGFISVILIRDRISKSGIIINSVFLGIVMLLSGVAISQSDGFTVTLSKSVIFLGYLTYLLLFALCIVLKYVGGADIDVRDSGRSSMDIISDVNKLRTEERARNGINRSS